LRFLPFSGRTTLIDLKDSPRARGASFALDFFVPALTLTLVFGFVKPNLRLHIFQMLFFKSYRFFLLGMTSLLIC
jgi:hypothetical protein